MTAGLIPRPFVALRRHVGLAGCCRQVQGSRYHRRPHQGEPLSFPLDIPSWIPNPALVHSSELPAVPEPSSPVLEPSPPFEVLPDPVSESAESKTSPRLPPTRPDERVVDEVDDCRIPPFSGSTSGRSLLRLLRFTFSAPCILWTPEVDMK